VRARLEFAVAPLLSIGVRPGLIIGARFDSCMLVYPFVVEVDSYA